MPIDCLSICVLVVIQHHVLANTYPILSPVKDARPGRELLLVRACTIRVCRTELRVLTPYGACRREAGKSVSRTALVKLACRSPLGSADWGEMANWHFRKVYNPGLVEWARHCTVDACLPYWFLFSSNFILLRVYCQTASYCTLQLVRCVMVTFYGVHNFGWRRCTSVSRRRISRRFTISYRAEYKQATIVRSWYRGFCGR